MSSIARKHRSFFLSMATFIAVIFIAHSVWGWRILLSFWQEISLSYLILFILLYWFSYFIRSLRISLYFKSNHVNFPLRMVLPLVIKQTFWSNLLPAKAGEISFPILMKRYFATPYTHSVAALLVLRLFDVYVLVAIALAIYLFTFISYWVGTWLILMFFFPLIGIFMKRKLIGLSYRYRHKTKGKLSWRILTKIPDTPKKILIMSGLSWINWITKILLFSALLATMTHLGLGKTTIAALLGEISGMLPSLPGGFGSYEAAVSFGLMAQDSGVNILQSSDLVAAALNAHFFILFNSIFAAMIIFIVPNQPLVEPNL